MICFTLETYPFYVIHLSTSETNRRQDSVGTIGTNPVKKPSKSGVNKSTTKYPIYRGLCK